MVLFGFSDMLEVTSDDAGSLFLPLSSVSHWLTMSLSQDVSIYCRLRLNPQLH